MPNVEVAKARGHFRRGWTANHRLPRAGTGGAIFDPRGLIDQIPTLLLITYGLRWDTGKGRLGVWLVSPATIGQRH